MVHVYSLCPPCMNNTRSAASLQAQHQHTRIQMCCSCTVQPAPDAIPCVQRPIVLLGNLPWAPKGLPAKCIQTFAFEVPPLAAVQGCLRRVLQAEGRAAPAEQPAAVGQEEAVAQQLHGFDLRCSVLHAHAHAHAADAQQACGSAGLCAASWEADQHRQPAVTMVSICCCSWG